MIFANLLSYLLVILFGTVAFAQPIPRLLELNRRAVPTGDGGVFVPHPRPGKPVKLPPTTTSSAVFQPTKTPIKVIKNPKVSKIPNPKNPNK